MFFPVFPIKSRQFLPRTRPPSILAPRLRGAPALARWAPKSGSQSPPCAPSSRPSSPRPPAPWPVPGLRSWQVSFLGKPWGFPWLVHVWDVYSHGSTKNEAQKIKHSIFFNNFNIMQAMLGQIGGLSPLKCSDVLCQGELITDLLGLSMGKLFHFNKPGVGFVGVSTFRSSSKCDNMFLCVKSPNPGTFRDWQMFIASN